MKEVKEVYMWKSEHSRQKQQPVQRAWGRNGAGTLEAMCIIIRTLTLCEKEVTVGFEQRRDMLWS